MSRLDKARQALRCRATSKRTGCPCKAPAVRGWTVCRFHGAGGGGPKGASNGNYRHGAFTAEAVWERQAMAEIVREWRELERVLQE